MADAASYYAQRAQMRLLVKKGFLQPERAGLMDVFTFTIPAEGTRESALSE